VEADTTCRAANCGCFGRAATKEARPAKLQAHWLTKGVAADDPTLAGTHLDFPEQFVRQGEPPKKN